MGNIPPSSLDKDFAFGSTTEQIDGVLTLKKRSTPIKNAKEWRRGSFLSKILGPKSHHQNRHVKSRLMRSILQRDWQKVLIRARLFPSEIHKYTVVEILLPKFRDSEGSGGRNTKNSHGKDKSDETKYYRVKVLPIHAACALRPPPEVVRALLSHAVGSAFSSDAMSRKNSKKSFKPNPKHPQPLSNPVPLHHEHNTSFAAVAVERLEDPKLRKVLVEKLCILGDTTRKTSRRHKSVGKLRLLSSTTEDCESNEESGHGKDGAHVKHNECDGSDNRDNCEHTEDIALFLKQMEDRLARNGQCRSVFRDASVHPEPSNSSRNQRKFVMDFDPSVLLPSPSTVRMMEKQRLTLNTQDHDLFSLENSIGDSDTAMTTSTDRLVEKNIKGKRKDSEESSSLKYLTDESSSSSFASSSLLQPPSTDSEDSDDISNDSNSFLQLTADGKLTMVDLDAESNSNTSPEFDGNGYVNDVEEPTFSTDTGRFCVKSSSNSECSSSPQPSFVPEDIRLDAPALFRSLPRSDNREKAHGQRTEENKPCCRTKSASRKQGQDRFGLSRLLPLHIACLYGASAAVLRILLEEYPEGSSIEILGMLPIHMVAANWSLAATEGMDNFKSENHTNYSEGSFDFEMKRIEVLVLNSPGSMWANSSAHGLRPLEYFRMLLCYPSNASDEGMIRAKKILDCEEERQNPQYSHGETLKHPQKVVKRLNKGTKGSNSFEKDDAANCHNHIEATSTCTTSGLSSTWMVKDSSSEYSSSASSARNTRQITLGSLLNQSRWKEAMSLLQTNPETAKEPFFNNTARDIVSGNDESFSSSSSSGLKEQLPIHLVCQMLKNGFSIPIDLVRLIISSYPEGLGHTDDDTMSGSLPLHLICDSFRRRFSKDNHFFVEVRREYVSERLQVLNLLLSEHPDATHFVDNRGRLPLHRAVLVGAPIEAIELLVYPYPKAMSLPDREGMSPFCLAKKTYSFGSPVTELLKQAWIYA